MVTKLSKAQREALARTIRYNIDGEESFKRPYDDFIKGKLLEVQERLNSGNHTDNDLEIAEIFQYLPYTHEEDERRLAIQLLAWHKISFGPNLRNLTLDQRREKLIYKLKPKMY